MGADAGVPRPRQPLVLPPQGRRPLLCERHRHRQHAEPVASDGAADGDGQPALLGRELPCRRLPLRPRHRARARRSGSIRRAGFSDAIRQDPVLARVKLITEPWDIGPGGYQLGAFPHPFLEFNDKFRDGVRRFWRGEGRGRRPVEPAARARPSSSTIPAARPASSINFVTAHDGFTLDDLVSYATKHNEANGEDNRDGSDENYSDNIGVEGPTADRAVTEARAAAQAQPAGDDVPQPGHADDAGRRRDRQQPGRQQQRLCAGQRDRLDRLVGARCRPCRLRRAG